MSNISLIDGHIDNAEHCVCCGAVIPEGRQVCIICGLKTNYKQSAADVVEVVRCKDCKWYQNLEIVDKVQTRCFNLAGLYRVCNPNDFCRYGERKDGE